MSLRSLEQERAKFSWDAVNSVKSKDFKSEYKSLVKKTPALILTNGLGNTLGYLNSKGKTHHTEIIKNINEWGKKRGYGDGDVLKWIMNEKTSSFDVIQASKEILSMLNWLKRFCDAELKGDDKIAKNTT